MFYRQLVSSKFEPTYARRAFPCLDEPEKKATFAVKLVKPLDATWVALSNMDKIDVSVSRCLVFYSQHNNC